MFTSGTLLGVSVEGLGDAFVIVQVLFGKGLQADTKPLVDIFADVLSHKFELRSAYATVVGQVSDAAALDGGCKFTGRASLNTSEKILNLISVSMTEGYVYSDKAASLAKVVAGSANCIITE